MDAVGAEAVRSRAAGRRSALAWLWEFLCARNNLALGAAAGLMIGLFSWSVLLRGEVQDLQEGHVQSLQR